jgi:hypothetical protein
MRVRYVFNADRTGTETQVAPRTPWPTLRRFSFWITGRGIFMRTPGAYLVNEDLHLQNGVLEDRGYFYYNPPDWFTPSGWEHYRCTRARRR